MNGRKSPDSRPSSRTRGLPIAGLNNSGRMSPLVEGRKSPLYDLDGRDSPSIDQIMNGTNKSISTPLIQTLKHSQQTSIGSISSTAGSSSIEGGFSTRNIHSPTSSTTLARGESRNDKPFIAYKEDFGLEIMINMIDGEAKKLYKRPVKSNDDKLMESIFGKKVKEIDLHPQVRELYADQVRQFDDLDQVGCSSLFTM